MFVKIKPDKIFFHFCIKKQETTCLNTVLLKLSDQ